MTSLLGSMPSGVRLPESPLSTLKEAKGGSDLLHRARMGGKVCVEGRRCEGQEIFVEKVLPQELGKERKEGRIKRGKRDKREERKEKKRKEEGKERKKKGKRKKKRD